MEASRGTTSGFSFPLPGKFNYNLYCCAFDTHQPSFVWDLRIFLRTYPNCNQIHFGFSSRIFIFFEEQFNKDDDLAEGHVEHYTQNTLQMWQGAIRLFAHGRRKSNKFFWMKRFLTRHHRLKMSFPMYMQKVNISRKSDKMTFLRRLEFQMERWALTKKRTAFYPPFFFFLRNAPRPHAEVNPSTEVEHFSKCQTKICRLDYGTIK